MNNLGLSDERRHSRTLPEEGVVEVYFVWSRGKKKIKTRNGNQTVGVHHRASTVGPPRNAGSASPLQRPGTIDGADKRLSSVSGHSVSTGSEVGSSAGRAHGDNNDEDESDPEDSETPWTCTLILSRHGGAGGVDGADGSDSVVRVRVATFSPTPHHPKVVALLKVPFPLPDVVVDQLQVCRRAVSAQGIARPSWNLDAGAPDGGGELVLTAEEIKDVVSSTGLWLVVRESIGGVGKISRKGDGWRIRA
jgi:hypothetical protein